jgi:hypothetical protein
VVLVQQDKDLLAVAVTRQVLALVAVAVELSVALTQITQVVMAVLVQTLIRLGYLLQVSALVDLSLAVVAVALTPIYK